MKIGIIGTGNIAQYLLETIQAGGLVNAEVTALFGRNEEVGPRLEKEYGARFYADFEEFLQSPVNLIVEAATVGVAAQHMASVLASGRDLILSSIGALSDESFLEEMKQLADQHGRHIYLPSGAVGGLDLLQSAHSIGGLKEVRLTTRKSFASLGLEPQSEAKCLFDGSAADAIKRFPKNVNVALLLSIAGLGAQKTQVRVIADPDVERNTHSIEAAGDFGKMNLTIENEPMPNNPKTSYLAALSILSTLKKRGSAITVGS